MLSKNFSLRHCVQYKFSYSSRLSIVEHISHPDVTLFVSLLWYCLRARLHFSFICLKICSDILLTHAFSLIEYMSFLMLSDRPTWTTRCYRVHWIKRSRRTGWRQGCCWNCWRYRSKWTSWESWTSRNSRKHRVSRTDRCSGLSRATRCKRSKRTIRSSVLHVLLSVLVTVHAR